MCDELVMIYDSDEEIENSGNPPEIFEIRAPVKEVSEVITLDSESESEDYRTQPDGTLFFLIFTYL